MAEALLMIGLVVMFLLWAWGSGVSDRIRVEHMQAMKAHQDTMRENWQRLEVLRTEAMENARKAEALRAELALHNRLTQEMLNRGIGRRP